MSIPLVINGVTYDYPEVDDTDWGPDATDWAAAVSNGMLQKAGGLFQLLADVDFGTAYGIKSLYYKSRATSPAAAGVVRLGNLDVMSWRNFADSGDLALGVNSSDLLTFHGSAIQGAISVSNTSTINLTLVANALTADIRDDGITNVMVNSAAGIVYSKLDLSASIQNSDLATMAESTIKGRAASSGTGAPIDLTATQATAILNNFVGDSGAGGTKGLVPAPASGDSAAGKFLKADGSWSAPAGAGDVVGPGSATDNGFVRFDGTTGKLIKSSAATIVNADVSASAAIAYSKLALTGSIVNADVNASAAIAYSKLALTGSIVNADVGASAAIAYSKLAALTASRALVSDGSGFVSAATTTATEVGYVHGVTSAIQTQLDAKFTSPMTTNGDLISYSSIPIRIPLGAVGQQLVAGPTVPLWNNSAPINVQKFTSGSGTYNRCYYFLISTGSATAGATYTNNSITYTVQQTIASQTYLYASGSNVPTTSGTLTKASGTGDSTISFLMVRVPSYNTVIAVGGGGSGGAMATAVSSSGGGGGGGGGATVISFLTNPAVTYAYAVGAGGAAPTAGANDGNAGGASTFGGSISAGGGAGGRGGTASASASNFGGTSGQGAGGTPSGGDINIYGEPGLQGLTLSASIGVSGSGGGSAYGGGARYAVSAGSGNSASGYGGAGSGAVVISGGASAAGGAGAAGQIIVIEHF